jgi:hypothetical protein
MEDLPYDQWRELRETNRSKCPGLRSSTLFLELEMFCGRILRPDGCGAIPNTIGNYPLIVLNVFLY